MSQPIYGLVKTIHPPTVVETCCSCNFFSYKEDNIVVSGGNRITVYRVVQIQNEQSGAQPENIKPKLECAASYHLFGKIVSISPLHLPGNDRDLLLISFTDAKLSVVEYDDKTCDIVTLSMHYFEEDELKSGLYSNHKKPVVRVDPDIRCAAMLIYGNQLVIFPVRKEAPSEEANVRGPFAPSYIIDLSKMEDKILNIKDIQFLHGYYEPTLFILYEPIRTWAGRLPVRNDTCKIAAISLNMQEKVHPVIWSLDNLPYDCIKTLAVPKPHGGVMVFAACSIMYLNQSVPPYAASVNSFSDKHTAFPMKNQEGVVLRLDNSHSCLISHDQIVITTSNGEIYVLTLVIDSMRAVEKFHFDKAASTVLPSCICKIRDGILFLGSRYGNSLLLKYTVKDVTTLTALPASTTSISTENEEKLVTSEPPANKKKKTETDFYATDAADLEQELDELEMYGSQTEASVKKDETAKLYNFQVCDSLLNIGPCGRAAIGEPAFLSEELSPLCAPDHNLELVTPSGFSKNGALTFLQRTVRPQIITTFQLSGVLDIWTVKGPLNNEEEEKEEETTTNSKMSDDMHSYLILSKEDSTMVLQTTEDISELDTTGFNTQDPTIYAGNIGGNYTVQVTAKSIRLLHGVKQLQIIPIDIGSSLEQTSLSDPYLIVVSEKCDVMLLKFIINEEGEPRLTVVKQQDELDCKVSTACLYKDTSGLFTCEISNTAAVIEPRKHRLSSSAPEVENETLNATMESIEEEDEDELLYGGGDTEKELPLAPLTAANGSSTAATTANPTSDTNAPLTIRREHDSTYWLVVVTPEHELRVYTLPDLEMVFNGGYFTTGHKVVFDRDSVNPIKESDTKGVFVVPKVKELLVAGLGVHKYKPHIFARTTGDGLLIYEAFAYPEPHDDDMKKRLQLRFKKINHDLILRERRRVTKKRQTEGDNQQIFSRTLLRHFENIGSYSGVFVGGRYPHWCILSSKGILRTHPMSIDGRVMSMSPFHNVNCPNGFMYFNRSDELRIAILPSHLTYEHLWPLRKVPTKSTVHYIIYHPDAKIYMMASSEQVYKKAQAKIENEKKTFETVETEERYIFCPTEQHRIQLFSPVSCEPIPGTKIDMEEYESITMVKLLTLSSEGTSSGREHFFGVATNTSFSEEHTSKGRMMLYSVVEVVPEPGQPLTKDKLKEIYAKEQKGPVTSFSHVCGMVIAAIGQKIYVYQLKDNDLVGVSFIDTMIYIHEMRTVKNLILIADIQQSISVLRYQPEYRVLSTVSRDVKPMEVFSTEFYIDNTTLGFVCSDNLENISVYLYQPENTQSNGGTQLLRKADINVGTRVNSMCRVKCKLNDPTTDVRFGGLHEKRHATYFVGADGSIGVILPVTERVFRRLDMTQRLMYSSIPHTAGLNPKTYRSIKVNQRGLTNAQHHIIDGDVVWKFLSLTYLEQANVAKRMGTTCDQIIEDLLEIDRTTTHF